MEIRNKPFKFPAGIVFPFPRDFKLPARYNLQNNVSQEETQKA